MCLLTFSGISTTSNRLQHGGSEVLLATGKMNVVFRHAACSVAHEFSKGFDVHAIDDRLGAKMMSDAVHLHVIGQLGLLTEASHSQAEVRPVPRRAVRRHEHLRRSRPLLRLYLLEKPDHAWHQLNHAGTRRPLRPTGLVMVEDDDAPFEVNALPGQIGHFARSSPGVPEEHQDLAKPGSRRWASARFGRLGLVRAWSNRRPKESEEFGVGHGPARLSTTMPDAPEGVGDNDSLLDGPIERPLDDADDAGQCPIRFPLLVAVEPAGQVDRKTVRNQPKSLGFGEFLQVVITSGIASGRVGAFGMGEVQVND